MKSMTMSARPSCTSVNVSGVTSLQTFKASSMVFLTSAFTSCHGNLIILEGIRHWMMGSPGTGLSQNHQFYIQHHQGHHSQHQNLSHPYVHCSSTL